MGKDEKFIKMWERYRKKGKSRYILTNIIACVIGTGLTLIVFTMLRWNDIYKVTRYFPLFLGLITGNIIMSPINWDRNEKRYNKLLENK
ncbi:hypothetical protein [uncultured Clostridium sp.]|uniref:hypothetical protein n=1 Tax=uncultured Clostridium sp. TaxID=59620 RepID=UPI0028F073AD|nr:hypothetical protein [uncultured Clostridium sp.]